MKKILHRHFFRKSEHNAIYERRELFDGKKVASARCRIIKDASKALLEHGAACRGGEVHLRDITFY